MKQHIKTHKLGKVEHDDMDTGNNTNNDYIHQESDLISKSDVVPLQLPFHSFHTENLAQ